MKLLQFVAIAIAVGSFSACTNEYQSTKTGLEYKIVNCNSDALQPAEKDVVAIRLTYYNSNGQFIDNTPLFKMQLKIKNEGQPSVEEGLTMMHKGDSAVFRLQSSQFNGSHIQDKDSLILVGVKLIDVIPYEEYLRDRADARIAGEKEEDQLLNEYLKREGIDIEPTMSGLYYIELRKGNGPAPTPGKLVTIHYEGCFLNGQIFDSSYDRHKLLQFKLGSMEVIQGLEEGIARMNKGGKSRLIIPSPLAYGDEQVGPVPPFATLIFDVELVDVEL